MNAIDCAIWRRPVRVRPVGIGLLISTLSFAPIGVRAETPEALLPKMSQALYDAVATGNKAVWDATLANDILYTDENGDTYSKAQLLETLVPLPKGVTGEIVLRNTKIRTSGDIGVLTYDAMETEHFFGQILHTHYHATDTYQLRGTRWLLIAEQTEVLPSEPTPLNASTVNTSDIAGVYRLTADRTVTVSVDSGRVLWTKANGSPIELIPLGGDSFYQRGAPRGYKLFIRDAAGHVTAVADRRDNNDVLWTKVPN